MTTKEKAPGNWEKKNTGPEKVREHGDIPLRPERDPKEKFPVPEIAPKKAPGSTTL